MTQGTINRLNGVTGLVGSLVDSAKDLGEPWFREHQFTNELDKLEKGYKQVTLLIDVGFMLAELVENSVEGTEKAGCRIALCEGLTDLAGTLHLVLKICKDHPKILAYEPRIIDPAKIAGYLARIDAFAAPVREDPRGWAEGHHRTLLEQCRQPGLINPIPGQRPVNDPGRSTVMADVPLRADVTITRAALPPTGLYWWVRDTDETGMSGAGRVAQVAVFEDGSAALRWLKARNSAGVCSSVFYDSIADLIHVHGHGERRTGHLEPVA